MANKKISEVPLTTSLNASDKVPIGQQGGALALTASISQLAQYFTRTMNISWTDISGRPTLSPVATSGEYNDLKSKPTIPTKTSDLQNTSNFTTLEEVNKEVDGKGFLTMKEADTTFLPIKKLQHVKAEPITQLTIEKNTTYLIDCSAGDIENIQIMNLVNDYEDIKVFIQNVTKPLQLFYPKNVIFLTPKIENVNETEEVEIVFNARYVKCFKSNVK